MPFINAPAGWRLATWSPDSRDAELRPLLGWKHHEVGDYEPDIGTPVVLSHSNVSEVLTSVASLSQVRRVVQPDEDFDLTAWARAAQDAWDAEVERQKVQLLAHLKAGGAASYQYSPLRLFPGAEAALQLIEEGVAVKIADGLLKRLITVEGVEAG